MDEPVRVSDVSRFLEQFAPTHLAESWDNVGLLVGDDFQEVNKMLTCLTVTPEVVEEAIAEEAQLIVSHHPMPFRSLKRITTRDTVGTMLLRLIAHEIAVYSPHTAFDSCSQGINQQLAEGLQLSDIRPLLPREDDPRLGTGRFGKTADGTLLEEIAAKAKELTGASQIKIVGPAEGEIATVAVGCGSAGEFLTAVIEKEIDCLILGETSFHTCLEAQAQQVGLILVGHYASERFAVEKLAAILAEAFPRLQIWTSRSEMDPIRFA